MLELKTHNYKQHSSVYRGSTVNSKLGRFLEFRKCYITCVICAIGICWICPHSPSGVVRPWACAYISGKSLLPMLHIIITCTQNI